MLFDDGGALFSTPTGFEHVSFDTSDFHTYRFAAPGNSNQFDFFIDDQHVRTVLAVNSNNRNRYEWGDGRSLPLNGASADWDYVRVWTVPEPSGALLSMLALGIAVMFLRPLRNGSSTLC